MYVVKDFLHFLYPLIWQNWVTRLAWSDDLYFLTNQAINEIYNFQPERADHRFHWSWTHRKDLFHMSEDKKWMWVCFTRRPVRMVDEFWTSKRNDVYDLQEDKCYCDMNLPEDTWIIKSCACDCDCFAPCEPIELKQIRPHANLCPWTFQIAWWFTKWMWWLDWQIVRVNTWLNQDVWLWMTYYCWPTKVSKPNDQVPIPDSFMHLAAKIIAANCMPMTWEQREQDDLQYYSTFRREMECLVKQDPEFPKFVETKSNSNYVNKTVNPKNLSYSF